MSKVETQYQPKTGVPCGCRRGVQRDNCPTCEGTGWRVDFAKIRAAVKAATKYETAPSPWLPWCIDPATDQPLAIIEDTADGIGVCESFHGEPDVARANAEFIVRACNAYPALVEALRACIDTIEGYGSLPEGDSFEPTPASLKLARAAVAKAVAK